MTAVGLLMNSLVFALGAETSATAANLGVSLDTRPASYTAELAPADARTTKRPLIKDVRAKTTMGDEAREERNQLARQDASVSTYNRRSPLGSASQPLSTDFRCIRGPDNSSNPYHVILIRTAYTTSPKFSLSMPSQMLNTPPAGYRNPSPARFHPNHRQPPTPTRTPLPSPSTFGDPPPRAKFPPPSRRVHRPLTRATVTLDIKSPADAVKFVVSPAEEQPETVQRPDRLGLPSTEGSEDEGCESHQEFRPFENHLLTPGVWLVVHENFLF
ncbi:hypothetical protein Q1695_016086 [Nippostrongylus brasiliensis]|nr:hypothetical protein Q1695_016086 [Nippostrongylus brasiliensis]